MYKQPQALIFLGPPGSGKGTQAARLSAALEIPAISTGEILRRECQSGSSLGRRIEAILHSGRLVHDGLMNEIVEKRLARPDCKGGCILDGFPRTVEQAQFLDGIVGRLRIRKPIVLNFEVSADELIERLERRRQCPTCGRIYSLPPAHSAYDALCQNDGARLQARSDDQPSVIRERFRVHEHNARELIGFYRKAELHCIRAGQNIEQVTNQVFQALGLSGLAPYVSTPVNKLAAVAC